MKDTIICDLDGTLCNVDHRLHHVQKTDGNGLKRKADWDAFFAGTPQDTVNDAVHAVLMAWLKEEEQSSFKDEQRKVIFCSGRPERCRHDTNMWLINNYNGPVGDAYLHMRKDGDFRRDDIVKEEILNAHIDKDRVMFVLDDRQQVVDMWRRNGLQCFQVAEGNF